MQRTEPWKLLKDEATRPEAVKVIETLLYLIKQLTILSMPFLLDSTEKVNAIFGDTQAINLGTNPTAEQLAYAYDKEEINPNITPGILYSKVE